MHRFWILKFNALITFWASFKLSLVLDEKLIFNIIEFRDLKVRSSNHFSGLVSVSNAGKASYNS